MDVYISESCSRSKLYFVKVDVKACFDTIEQGKLLSILKEIITEVVGSHSVIRGNILSLSRIAIWFKTMFRLLLRSKMFAVPF